MDFDSSMRQLERDGFSWKLFRDYFPFGDIGLREGSYQKLVVKILECLESDKERELLLDMLDAQNCVFLEQVWIQNENSEGTEQPFPVEGHFITAQLQINSNLRYQYGLAKKDARQAMLNLPDSESLIDRLINSKAM